MMLRPPQPERVLTGALLLLVPAWLLGLDQVLPPLVVLVGGLWLLAAGRLRMVPETWLFVAFLALTLPSAAALEGGGAWLHYLRGSFNLVVGLAAFLVAAAARPDGRAFERWLQAVVGSAILVGLVSILVAGRWLPLELPAPLPGLFPESLGGSSFFRLNVLSRRLGVDLGYSLIPGAPRVSAFFFFQGGLAIVSTVFLAFVFLARRVLRGRWATTAVVAVAASCVSLLASGNRGPVLTGFFLVAVIALWRAVEGRRWRRAPIRILVAVLLLVGIVAVIPIGGEALWERVFFDFRVKSLTDRVSLYAETVSTLVARPLFGFGVQESAAATSRYLHLGTHSEPLNVAYRFGLLGLGAYLTVWATFAAWLARRIAAAYRARRSAELADLLPLWLGLAVLSLDALFLALQWDANVYWLCAALAGTARAFATRGPVEGRG